MPTVDRHIGEFGSAGRAPLSITCPGIHLTTEKKNHGRTCQGNRNKKQEQVNNKYLGTTVTKDNLIEEEIKERIVAGNRASFANQKILQSKLVSKKTKMKLYKALIRPVQYMDPNVGS